MATPTEDEIQGQINDQVLILEEADQFLRVNTPNASGMYDQFIAGVEGEFAPLAVRGADQFRAIASGMVSNEVGRAMIDPLLLEYGKQQNFPESDPESILDRLFIYFGSGSERVQSRVFTFGTPANGGSNTGNGVLSRLTVDRYGFDIENATPEVKTLKCVADRFSGSQIHQELFEIRGGDEPRDALGGYVGPQRFGAIRCLSADDSERILSNPSFNRYSGTAPNIDSITGWTVTTSINNFQIETTTTYRTALHEGDAPGAVRFEASDTLTQALSVARPSFVRGVPYYVQIAYYRESSCDGSLTLTVGANSVAVADLTAVSGATWLVLRLALDENLFFENFNETDLDIKIALASRTTGALLVDDIVIGPMTQHDGTYLAAVGGSTPYLVDDSITITDTATDSILQKWMWRIYGRYLSHTTSASLLTWAEPS